MREKEKERERSRRAEQNRASDKPSIFYFLVVLSVQEKNIKKRSYMA